MESYFLRGVLKIGNDMLAVRKEILKRLLQDTEFSKKFEEAKTLKEIIKLIEKYARKHGIKIAKL
ncbi:MAG: hypothetical protein ACUVUF_06915 [Candidatus Bathycorpusculaceae bacterium]